VVETGRIVNVENTEFLKTASVTAENINSVEKEVVILANALSEITRDKFIIRQDILSKSKNHLQLGGGFGIGVSDNGESGIHIDAILHYLSKDYILWHDGSQIGGMKHIAIGGVYNINSYFGIGFEYGMVADNIIDYFKSNYLHFVFFAMPRLSFEIGVFVEGITSAQL